jgi:hypothetical protein
MTGTTTNLQLPAPVAAPRRSLRAALVDKLRVFLADLRAAWNAPGIPPSSPRLRGYPRER